MLVYLLAVSAFQCDKCDKVTIKCDGVNPQKFEFGMFMTNDWELALNSPIASRPSFRSRLYWFPQWFLRILRTTKTSEIKATIPTTIPKVHLKGCYFISKQWFITFLKCILYPRLGIPWNAHVYILTLVSRFPDFDFKKIRLPTNTFYFFKNCFDQFQYKV